MKRSKKETLQLLLCTMISLFLLSYSALAQTAKIKGTITDQRTTTGMAGVSVKIKGSNTNVITDESGHFIINAAPGDILVITSIACLRLQSAKR